MSRYTIPKSQAFRHLKRLIANGGSAEIGNNLEKRTLMQTRAGRPQLDLPWPLSLFQPRDFTVYSEPIKEEEIKLDEKVAFNWVRHFSRQQSGEGIRAFLDGFQNDCEVRFYPEFLI